MRTAVWSGDAADEPDALVRSIARDRPGAAPAVADRIDRAASRLAHAPAGRPGRVAGTCGKVVSRTPRIAVHAPGDDRAIILRASHGKRSRAEGGRPAG